MRNSVDKRRKKGTSAHRADPEYGEFTQQGQNAETAAHRTVREQDRDRDRDTPVPSLKAGRYSGTSA